MIRLAKQEELGEILQIYDRARALMRRTGNPTQWAGAYPDREILTEDIRQGQLYVEQGPDGTLQGVFALIEGADPTYAYIEDGEWLNDAPYATVHRVASGGQAAGFFDRCLDFCRAGHDDLRIDTHADNKIMQHLILKGGFVRCGVIYVEDGTPRIAYQWTRRREETGLGLYFAL